MFILIYIIATLMFGCIFGSLIINFIQLHISNESTTAVIKDVKRKIIRINDDGEIERTECFYPVLEYYVEGEKIVKELEQGFTENTFEVGQKIKVKYSPKYPKDAYMEMFEKDIFIRNIFGAILAVTFAIFIFWTFYQNR